MKLRVEGRLKARVLVGIIDEILIRGDERRLPFLWLFLVLDSHVADAPQDYGMGKIEVARVCTPRPLDRLPVAPHSPA